MFPDSIDRDILIDAPIEAVWRVVTDPAEISRWWMDAAEFDARPGAEGTLTFTSRATNAPAVVRLTVQDVEPPHRFAFRWVHPEGAEADERNSLLVEFMLAAEGDATRLTVRESGFSTIAWSPEELAEHHPAHEAGWDRHLADLREYAAAGARVAD